MQAKTRRGTLCNGKSSTLTIADVFIQTLRESLLREQLQRLSSRQLSIESYSARHVSGTVTAEEDGFLFTSIPDDDGWSVRVDGVLYRNIFRCRYAVGCADYKGSPFGRNFSINRRG